MASSSCSCWLDLGSLRFSLSADGSSDELTTNYNGVFVCLPMRFIARRHADRMRKDSLLTDRHPTNFQKVAPQHEIRARLQNSICHPKPPVCLTQVIQTIFISSSNCAMEEK